VNCTIQGCTSPVHGTCWLCGGSVCSVSIRGVDTIHYACANCNRIGAPFLQQITDARQACWDAEQKIMDAWRAAVAAAGAGPAKGAGANLTKET
jgi:hypothetical protein